MKKLGTTVKADIERNKDGYLRIVGLDVQIQLEVSEEDRLGVPRRLTIFENYCTVTQSVRKGIEINASIN